MVCDCHELRSRRRRCTPFSVCSGVSLLCVSPVLSAFHSQSLLCRSSRLFCPDCRDLTLLPPFYRQAVLAVGVGAVLVVAAAGAVREVGVVAAASAAPARALHLVTVSLHSVPDSPLRRPRVGPALPRRPGTAGLTVTHPPPAVAVTAGVAPRLVLPHRRLNSQCSSPRRSPRAGRCRDSSPGLIVPVPGAGPPHVVI